MNDEIILTAYCFAYNHEKYIRQTLEGFVNQQTTYKYKVIVHDDASTDRTPEIIKEYADKYPGIIVPVFQHENQYSKKVKMFDAFIKPMLEGKYVASCEGDDYWCDPLKLQKQIDFLENHPDFSACVHNTEKIKADGSPTGRFYNKSAVDGEITADEVIKHNSMLIHINSVVCRKEYRENQPEVFSMPDAPDLSIIIYLATVGKIWYMADVMSKYRLFSEGSWTSKIKQNREKRIGFSKKAITAFEKMNEYTGYKYKNSFNYVIKYSKARNACYEKNLPAILSHPGYWPIILKKLMCRITDMFEK